MHLDLGVCVIRPWREGDAASLASHANSRPVWQDLRDDFPHPYTENHAARFLARAVTADPPTHFAIVIGGEAVGGIGYHLTGDARRVDAELGYWLGDSYWGRGIATAAVRAMTAFAFGAHTTLHRIYAVLFAWNAASARVLEKAGFTLESSLRHGAMKQGRAAHQVLYAIVREEGRKRHVPDRR
jgi:ribosomal-protein-alanine N-acetyltransferase